MCHNRTRDSINPKKRALNGAYCQGTVGNVVKPSFPLKKGEKIKKGIEQKKIQFNAFGLPCRNLQERPQIQCEGLCEGTRLYKGKKKQNGQID